MHEYRFTNSGNATRVQFYGSYITGTVSPVDGGLREYQF